MGRFSASFTPSSYGYLESPNTYMLEGILSDNNGMWAAPDAQVGDVIYVNTSSNGGPIFTKYVILEIVDNSNPPDATFNVLQIYPDPNDNPQAPWGTEGMIGRPDQVGIVQLLDWSTQFVSNQMLIAVQNYQLDLMNKAVLIICSNNIAPIAGGGTGSNLIYNSAYTGAIDGDNAVFITAYNFLPNSTQVYYNGQKITLGKDYIEASTNIISLAFAPQVTDVLTINYAI